MTKQEAIASDHPGDPALSRRTFMKGAAAATAVAAGAGAVPRAASAAVPVRRKHQMQYGMIIDLRRCTGCHACSVACKAEFDVPLGGERSWVEYVEKGDYPDAARSFLPRLCNHCSRPPCVRVCPTGATYKREQDGIVVLDKAICIGCKSCIQACPYSARFFNPVTRTADKCELCLHRVANGVVPACVNTCVGRARIFGDLNDPGSEISHVLASNIVTQLRTAMGTQPNVYYIAADHSDEHDARYQDQYIRVTTHRREKKRR